LIVEKHIESVELEYIVHGNEYNKDVIIKMIKDMKIIEVVELNVNGNLLKNFMKICENDLIENQ